MAEPPPSDAPKPDAPRRLRILHLEDNPQDVLLVREMLRADHVDCNVVVVSTPEEFERELARGDVDVVISDYSLPHYCGADALKHARETGRDLPFIFVSGSIGEERAVEVVRMGATDYVMKEHLRRLGIAVQRAVEASEEARHRREAETRLAEEREFLEDVFTSVQDGIVVLDADLKVVRTNPTMERLFPDRMPLIGQPSRIFCPDGPCHPGAFAIRDGQPSQMACQMETAQGLREFSIYSYPFVSRRTGRQAGVILYLRDVTRERALQEQLFQSQKMESIGQLAGSIAHDFNNILQAIMGFSDILAADLPEGDPRREDVLEIRKATDRAVALTGHLLAFSRKQVLAIADLDLNERVGGMDGMLQRLIPEDVRIRFDLDPAPAVVRADPGQIEQVILNLAVNARDAMPGGGELSLATRLREVSEEEAAAHGMPWRAGRYVCLSVRDTGTGIPPEVVPRLFEPFFTTKDKGKGTGLGLSTVYGIVKQHGGWLALDTAVGRGTTFTVYLPMKPAQETE